jgi:hypothetical protein
MGPAYRRDREPGPVNGAAGKRKVLARGGTTVAHAAAGIVTTNVDLTAYGLPAITKCVERLAGFTVAAPGAVGFSARLRLTSTTNLEIVSRSETAGARNIRVKWEIQEAQGTVQRGTEAIAVNNSEVKSDIAITAVNMDYAKAYSNGCTPSAGATYPVLFSVQLTTTTNLETYASANADVTITGAWVVDGG